MINKKYMLVAAATLMMLGVLTGCSTQTTEEPATSPQSTTTPETPIVEETPTEEESVVADGEEVVNVYSARHYDIDSTIYENFTEATNIKVNVIEGKAPEILARLKSEGEDTPADVFLTADIANLYQAVEADLLTPINSEIVDSNIPAELRGEGNEWVALTQRARIIAYDKETIDPSMLSTYYALTDEAFEGKILIRSSESSYNQSLLASIIAETSEEEAKEWAAGMVTNMAREPKGNDRDQLKAVASGEGEIAILNTYYIGRMMNSDDPEEVKAVEAVGIFLPENLQMNISGISMIKYSENQENAIQLIEYLTSPEVQTLYTDENYEYPANPAVEANEILAGFGEYTKQDVSLTEVGKYNSKATEIFGQVGWK